MRPLQPLPITMSPIAIEGLSSRNSDGRAATTIVLIGIATMLVPVYLLGISLAESAEHAVGVIRSGEYHIPPPPESVATWPLIGQRLHGVWLQASTDLTALARQMAPQLKSVGLTLLGTVAGVGMGFLIFVAALIVAGIFMAFGERGSNSMLRICSRVSGPAQGPKIAEPCTATIRAVAQGVSGCSSARWFWR